MQALAARVTGAAAEARPAARPDTSKQENGGKQEAAAGEGGSLADKLGPAAPPHPPHDGGGKAASTTRGRGQQRTPETDTADNAGSQQGEEDSFNAVVKKSPRHKHTRSETRKQCPRPEMA